jgi:cysteinyl-tRNA synthetase
MPVFRTAHGNVTVNNWGYQLQGENGSSLDLSSLAGQPHDMFVVDFSSDGSGANAFSSQDVAELVSGTGGHSLAVSYISIGEASEFRDHWQSSWTSNGTASGNLTAQAPDWLGPTNPDWPESRKVRFWEDAWQNVIFNDVHTGWLDQIVNQGFDAAYLDIVDAYYFWGAEVDPSDQEAGDPESLEASAILMMEFIIAMSEHARQTNPDFFLILQNGEFILNDAGDIPDALRTDFLDAVGAIAIEDLYHPGDGDENNPLNPDNARISILQLDFLANGIPVFVTDYLSNPPLAEQFEDLAISDGFIPYTAPSRDLDTLGEIHMAETIEEIVCTQDLLVLESDLEPLHLPLDLNTSDFVAEGEHGLENTRPPVDMFNQTIEKFPVQFPVSETSLNATFTLLPEMAQNGNCLFDEPPIG